MSKFSVFCFLSLLSSAALAAKSPSTAMEAKASKGSVQIALQLEKVSVGENRYPGYRISIKNIGTTALELPADIFSTRSTKGVRVEILNSAGKAPSTLPGSRHGNMDSDAPSDLKRRDKIDAWKKAGASEIEIAQRLSEISRTSDERASSKAISLGRSESIDNPSAGYKAFDSFVLPEGEYKVRAVCDLALNPADVKKYKLKLQPWNVRVETSWLNLEVQR